MKKRTCVSQRRPTGVSVSSSGTPPSHPHWRRSSVDRAGWERVLLLGLGVGVGVTRIYAGAHLPLDVVGGTALGVLVGESANGIRAAIA